MEHWTDQGIVLAARTHGESGAVVTLLTESRGRHAGYVQGGQSSRLRGTLEPGSLVSAGWRSRETDALGAFTLEPERNMAAPVMADPLRLAALQSACALCDAALPEREGHPGLFHGLLALLEVLGSESEDDEFVWGAAYVMWELALLHELGFGVNLDRCAAGGDRMTLKWVSPKSGCAVSASEGEPYKDRLLALPAFLQPSRGGASAEEVLKGLRMTGYFLAHRAFAQHSHGIPEARLRFEERFQRQVLSVPDLTKSHAI